MAFTPVSRGKVADIRIDRIENAEIPLTRKEDFIREISKLWQDTYNRFVLIGRYLNRAKETLPHGDYQAMVERELPFGVKVAHQLRAVASAIDLGVLPTERLPHSYSIIYQITTLSEDEREAAFRENIIRPDTTRAELIRFKRTVRSRPSDRRAALEAEHRRLLAEIAVLQERLRTVEDELGYTVSDAIVTPA